MNQSIPNDDEHRRPPGVSDDTIAALGTLSEALETIEQARGHLYALHQLSGTADLTLGKAADALEQAGHQAEAAVLRQDIIGLNTFKGRWTFQLIEEYDDGYYAAVKATEQAIRQQLVKGRRHIYESEMKETRRSHGKSGHEARP